MMESAVPETAPVRDQKGPGTFEELMFPHLSAAYNLARWLLRNDHDAEDAVQEAYLRAWRFFSGFQGGDEKSWLLEIVRNTCFTWLRRERREVTVPFDEATEPDVRAGEAEEAIAGGERRSALRNCIERLPALFREILVMRELEEMSYRQISEVVGLPIGTVMSRLSRARRRLEACASGRKIRVGK